MASVKKFLANQVNALVLTGPTTPEGKSRSSKNALKHGIMSRSLMPGESAEEWEAFLNSVHFALTPRGSLEEELAGRAACCAWLLRRIALFERAMAEEKISAEEKGPLSSLVQNAVVAEKKKKNGMMESGGSLSFSASALRR